MIKYCPFMSYRPGNVGGIYCIDDSCALYDEENCQCCFKTQALAAAAKPPITPIIMQPSVQTTPAVKPNGTGDWKENNLYRTDC